MRRAARPCPWPPPSPLTLRGIEETPMGIGRSPLTGRRLAPKEVGVVRETRQDFLAFALDLVVARWAARSEPQAAQ